MSLPTESNVTHPLARGYGAKVEYGTDPPESLYLRLAIAPGREARLQAVQPPDGAKTSENPEDMRGETGQTFSRSDFTGGEGLDRAHRPDGEKRDSTRFWDSRNIDITPGREGNPDKITLLHGVANIRADDAGNIRMPLTQIGSTLYMVCSDQATVDRTADVGANFTTENPHAGEGTQDVLDLTHLGDQVYAAITTNDIHVRSSAGTWTHWSDLSAVRIWGVKGRIIASTGTALYEAAAGAASVLLHTLPSGQSWTDVVDAGGAIMAGATDGNIYSFVDEDGTLALRFQGKLTDEEAITALGVSYGFLFVGTSQDTQGGGKIGRLWRAAIIGIKLQQAEVLRQWGDGAATLNHSPQTIFSTREAVWTGVIDSATESHLWRYHSDTAGIVRDLILPDGLVQGLAEVNDRMFATVLLEGLIREATTYATTGYLISPLADFFNAAKKEWVGARLTTGTMATDTDAVLAYSTSPAAITNSADSSWTTIISADHVSFGDLGETPIIETRSRYIAGKLTLTPNGAATATPEVLAFEFRGKPPITENDFQIPVNISARFESPGRKPVTSRQHPGRAVYDQLKAIEGQNITLTMLGAWGETVIGTATVSAPIEGNPRVGEPHVYCLLTVRGQRQ